MYKIKNKFIITLILILTVAVSCHDLDELNINPNGVDPETADLNLLMPTIITGVSKSVVSLGFGNLAGVMQHTQKDGWSSSHNDYDWDVTSNRWGGYYGILRNNNEFYKKAVENELEFHQGVALIMKSYTFGLITDLWGDAPYSQALKGLDGTEFLKPVFDNQKDIYLGILDDLETANTLLSNDNSSYIGIISSQDVLYNGDVSKWRKLANSLALRYYMRLSVKESAIASAGITKITSDPGKYPLIVSASDDANVPYPGTSPSDSWPTNTVFDTSDSGSYSRIKMCGTLVEKLQSFNDPRLAIWANKIETPLELVAGSEIDQIVSGIREISQDIVDDYEDSWNVGIDYDAEYVGIPPSVFAASQYNLNPNLEQGVFNPHASQLNDIYKETSGSLLLARLMSASEVHFILAEAAINGWASGSAETHYNMGVQESLNAWGVGDTFDTYIVDAPYAGLEEVMEQKWIASWSAAAEAWFDYRRTGLPDFQAGESAKREALPLRFYYNFNEEINLNLENAEAAISKLTPTGFNGDDSNNSAWSKMWLLQGTNKPY